MDPLAAGLRQPDARSCGPASVVMARLLHDGVALAPDAFSRAVLDCHRRLTAARLHGRWQVPWPRALGTPPWAVRRELEALTGRAHVVRVIRVRRSRAAAHERLLRSGGVLYVGSRLLPRHVLLVLPRGRDGTGDALLCYQPSRGTVVALPRDELVDGRLRAAGWPCPWLTVSPAGTDAPRGLRRPPR